MTTLQEKVDAALARKGMSPSEFGVALGYKYGYQGYHALFVTKKTAFTAERKAKATRILGVDSDYFEEGNEAEKRVRIARGEFEAFLAMPEAGLCNEDLLATIESIVFRNRVPSRDLYRLLALLLLGWWSNEEINGALKFNAELDAMPPLGEPPPKQHGKAAGKQVRRRKAPQK